MKGEAVALTSMNSSFRAGGSLNGGESHESYDGHYEIQAGNPGPRKHWINRSQLYSSLGGVATQGITLIVAPAGSGKTTAMTQIVHGSKQRISWVSLDEHDNDLHRFWRYLVHTLQPHLSAGASDRLLSMLAEFSEHSVRPFLDQCLNELHEVAGPISLALDDYHVITRCEIHDSLNYWLDHLPPGYRLSSHHVPSLR